MSAIDQAFIRAYELDEAEPASSHLATAKGAARVATIQQTKVVESIAVQAVEAAVAQPQVKPGAAAVRPMAPPRRSLRHEGRRATGNVATSSALDVRAAESTRRGSLQAGARSRFVPLVDRQQSTHSAAVGSIAASRGDDPRRRRRRPQPHRRRRAVGRRRLHDGVACLARLLVEAGKTVAIVDANFAKPGLATHLGLAAESAGKTCSRAASRWPRRSSTRWAIASRCCRSPGGPAAASRLETIHASVTAGVLRYHYDIVLFDLGVVADPRRARSPAASSSNAVSTASWSPSGRGAAAAQPQQLLRSAPELATICLGVVENQLRAA